MQRRSLLRLIAVAVEHRLPLAPLLEAWAADERGVQQRRVERVAALLRQGTFLPDAVEEVSGVLSESDVLAIRFGAQSGTLTASLDEALRDESTDGDLASLRWTVGYLVVIGTLFVAIMTFIGIKITPVLSAIFQDFDLEEPVALRGWLRLTEAVVGYWWVVLIAGVMLAWAAVSAVPGRFLRNSVLSRFFAPVRKLRTADLLENLSVAARGGRPISGAISTLARYHFDPLMRQKLLFVRNEIEQGADVWQSLAGAALLTAPEERLLQTAERVGNRAWILNRLASGKRRRARRWMQRMSELLLPAVVLLFGALVLFQALAVMMPLVSLIDNLGS